MLIVYFQDCSMHAHSLHHLSTVYVYFWITLLVAIWQTSFDTTLIPTISHSSYLPSDKLFDPEYRDITFSFSFCFGLENKTLYNVDSYAFALLWNTRFQWFTCVILTPLASHKRMQIDKISSTVLCLYTRFHHHLSLLSYEINFMPTEERDMIKKFISRIIFH